MDSEDLKNLPDSLQLPKGYEKLGSLPILSDKPSIEDLKAALQTQKIDCASYLAGYSCGQHDAPAVPSGDIIQVKTGDEIAINSVGFEVVELDGSGNGKGIVKVSMFNNAKFGVEFKGIKVAKGGCVVAGEAILSNVDMALLSEEQRKKLAETYATFTKVLAIADSLAPQIAETYNSIADLLKAVRAKAKIVIDKIAKNEKPSTKELKDLAKLSETAINAKKKELEGLKKQAGADTSKYVASLGTWLVKQDNALACVKTLPSSEPDTKTKKGGPFLEDDDYYGGCDITALTEEEPANVTNTPSQHYHISINMTTELWLDNEGKSFTKLYVDCIAKEIKEWTYFDATLNKLTEGKIYPFASNSFYVNQSSYEASKLGMPMAGKWGDNIVSIASTYVDDFTFLGRVLEFCPNLTNEKEVKYPWHSLFLGAKNHSKSADFAENVKTISDVTYALVDGYYLVRGIAKIGLKGLLTAFESPMLFKNVDEFALTFDSGKKLSSTIRGEAYNYFKQGKWQKLEELFNANKINGGWPPNRGFINYEIQPLKAGFAFDRYGGYFDRVDGVFRDKGNFVSKMGASFESRALPASTMQKTLTKYRVLKDIPEVKSGKAIPWFNQKGMGIQYELPENIDDLLKNGYIEKIK